jgi:hypothetical protein
MLELLWSINERVGGNPGKDMPHPAHEFELDMVSLYIEEIEEQERRDAKAQD